MATLLLYRSADIEAKTASKGNTALLEAAENGHAAIVALLLDRRANAEARSTSSGNTGIGS